MPDTGTLITNISQAELEKLEEIYTFEDRAQVLNFIDQHPFLVSVLLEAPPKIGEYFHYKELRLEKVIDYEIPTDIRLVLSIIVLDLTPEEAVDRLGDFELDWWLPLSTVEIREVLVMSVDFPDEL